ncbi:MAG: cytidine deaminase [Clostridia bacterium]|nr:cytidine deaminase [Clostridia bacterium]
MTIEQREKLIKASIDVRKNAYAPFSHFSVGAAVLTKKGNIYSGCNFESIAFGAGVCAERVAIGNAISNGEREITALCVSGKNSDITPCGICRQVLSEFGNIEILCSNEDGSSVNVYDMKSLLPFAFDTI